MIYFTKECHKLSLTGLNAFVYTGLNAQSYKWMVGSLTVQICRAPLVVLRKREMSLLHIIKSSPLACSAGGGSLSPPLHLIGASREFIAAHTALLRATSGNAQDIAAPSASSDLKYNRGSLYISDYSDAAQ